MKLRKKASGFFIVEVLIVLAIIGLLTVILLPDLQLYLNKVRFLDVVRGANSLKPAVELCILKNTGTLASCDSNAGGIPAASTAVAGSSNLGSLGVTNGTITGTASTTNGLATSDTYILAPTYTSGNVTWVATCGNAELCPN